MPSSLSFLTNVLASSRLCVTLLEGLNFGVAAFKIYWFFTRIGLMGLMQMPVLAPVFNTNFLMTMGFFGEVSKLCLILGLSLAQADGGVTIVLSFQCFSAISEIDFGLTVSCWSSRLIFLQGGFTSLRFSLS